MPAAKKPGERRTDHPQIGVRLVMEERKTLDVLLQKVRAIFPDFTHTQLVRALIRIGAEEAEDDPQRVLKRAGL